MNKLLRSLSQRQPSSPTSWIFVTKVKRDEKAIVRPELQALATKVNNYCTSRCQSATSFLHGKLNPRFSGIHDMIDQKAELGQPVCNGATAADGMGYL
jgi:hypothetical protein